ncbi:histidine kinase N-terminal 7TM domain-containing diguanylate cyclase [Crassaminicella profunda]|uniref:histidine kinase N-terminal 7TM domain-containing diguanylate cyclase n=1 Tax=Crassaminicella profunda TaxID=1286698 RepID=UPI001CA7646D|nr:diguanylate cyclase [Crassaminicella profunda]QZY54160.1 diguanylate cyclase [Crassaminicella profunda]
MNWDALLYTIPLWITLTLSMGIAIYIYKRRLVPGATSLFLMSLIMGLWSFGYIFELLSPRLNGKIFWDNVQMLGGAMGASCFAFALQFTKQKIDLKKKIWFLLFTEPVLIWILAVLNVTKLFRENVQMYTGKPFASLIYDMGIASWIDFIYGYGMYFLFLVLLIRFFIRSHDLYRRQATVIMIGLTITACGFILFFLGLTPKFMRDPSPFTFTILNLTLVWTIYRYGFLSIVPIARETIFEKMNDGLVVLDHNKLIVDMNLSAQIIINKVSNKVIGQSIEKVFPVLQEFLKNMDDSIQKHSEIILKRDIQEYIYEVELLPLMNKKHIHNGWLIVMHDVSKRKQLEKALQASEEKYRNVSEFANDGIVIVQNGKVQYVNKKLLEMIEYGYEEVVNYSFESFIIPKFRDKINEKYRKKIAGEDVKAQYETILLCKSGKLLDVEVNSALMNYNGSIAILGYIRDITERKRAEEALRELATKDPLTKLFNRRHFFTLGTDKFERSVKEQHPIWAMMIDIDHFKKVNDQYGHAIGDQVICAVAEMIMHSIRNCDMVGRYGGEEFAVLLPAIEIDEAQALAEKIRKNIMDTAVNTAKGEVFVTISLGLANRMMEDSVDKLFDRADQALYMAKQSGRNKVIVYKEK